MDLPTFRDLLTPAGRGALAEAAALAPTDAGFLAAYETVRKRHPPALAKAAFETVLLRQRARAKFAAADRLFFTREALEQASGDAVSAYRAARFAAYPTVLDLCCGIGADALALAAAGRRVEAIDRDELRLAMAEANAAALGLADRVGFHPGDVLTMPPPPADAAFVDPSRRAGERRFLDPDRYDPPLGAVRARFPAGFPLAAKIAPGVARRDVEGYDAEAEWLSVGGELKECVLWLGPLRTAGRRATVLASPGTAGVPPAPLWLERAGGTPAVPGGVTHTLAADRPPADPPAGEIGDYLFDPDPAVVRADLIGLLAEQLGADAVDHGVAVLTGPAAVASPFAAAYRVEHAAPLHAGKLRDYLRARGAGRVTVLKRAAEADADDLVKKLKLTGNGHRHLILTRSLGRTVAVVCEKV
ncbi:MAG: methyltransferase domain-containing protein [Gemmataceae bacterium]|nr:methyltransferase domain-containing protein [Gemmataceae bacterium]